MDVGELTLDKAPVGSTVKGLRLIDVDDCESYNARQVRKLRWSEWHLEQRKNWRTTCYVELRSLHSELVYNGIFRYSSHGLEENGIVGNEMIIR